MSRILLVIPLVFAAVVLADEPVTAPTEPSAPAAEAAPADAGAAAPETPAFELNDEVKAVLVPLFSSIVKAQVSRATVEMLADSLLSGQIVESETSTFQIASSVDPDRFTIYLKEPQQRIRVYCDGKSMAVALAPDAYFRIPAPIGTQEAATNLPVPLGPYPEPVLALTLAGVDPAISLVSGMKSVEIVGREKFRNEVPSVHLRGVQADNVTWNFWVSDEKEPKPLRLLVDLTPMLIASDQVNVPKGYSYQVRFDFLSWRVSGEVDDSLFVYTPAEGAKEFESLDAYYKSLASEVKSHPMLGENSPRFKARRLDGEIIDSVDFANKVVILDFWATWCAPCLESMPITKEVAAEFADKGVVFIALNTGEDAEQVEAFLKKHNLELNVLLDPEGKIADAFAADAIPQTVLIGKTGSVESVHVGFAGADALKVRLREELEVLSIGGLIESKPPEATDNASEPRDAAQDKK